MTGVYSEDQETEAEVFATELLMPEWLVRKYCSRFVEADISKLDYHVHLAPLCGVTRDIARKRLRELRII